MQKGGMTIRETSISLTLGVVLLTAACDTTSRPDPAAGMPVAQASSPTSSNPAPPAFVEAACGGCHAVEPPFLSPNPQAPSFESIANREGMSHKTIKPWLLDAHNYPEMMDFDLDGEQAGQVASYIITLQREDYVPAE